MKGTFHVYRKAWTSKKYDTYIRTIMTFEWVGEALFYTEEQNYTDTVVGMEVKEEDQGFVLPFGMNAVLFCSPVGKSTRSSNSPRSTIFIPIPMAVARSQVFQGTASRCTEKVRTPAIASSGNVWHQMTRHRASMLKVRSRHRGAKS